MGKDKCNEKLLRLDLFGISPMSLTYKGLSTYRTTCGSVVSILAILSYITLVGLKLTEFLGQTDPVRFHTVQSAGAGISPSLDLDELQFNFAVEAVPPEVG